MKHDLESEERFIATGRGKWSQAGVPHRGWHCVDIEDLGEPQRECEMCESQTIRYVHYMEHSDYPETLQVGCVCAGNMEGDISAARSRESMMKSRSGKRKRWLTRKWRVSGKGNAFIRADGYNVTIFERGDGWAAAISKVGDPVRYSRKNYQDPDHAKLSAFDQVTRLISGDTAGNEFKSVY